MKSYDEKHRPWYAEVTGYQWLVLVIASLGWIFDVFEGQIFVASMTEAMPSLLRGQSYSQALIDNINRIALAGFLLGGALGGIWFGRLSDRIGRTRTMVLTIATYSVFTFVSALSQAWWHLVICRFLVAMGVGGEWAVASAMVAEVFPKRARAWSLAIFHASSVFGTLLAILAGVVLIANRSFRITLPLLGWELSGWRLAFVLGVVPALLIIWIRLSLREPEAWRQGHEAQKRSATAGSFFELFTGAYRTRTLVGVGLAAIGLATFWGVHIYGKNLLRQTEENECLAQALSSSQPATPEPITAEQRAQLLQPYTRQIKNWEMIGMLAVTLGGGVGLVCFGPLAEWLGRRGAFLFFLLGGLISALCLFQFVTGKVALLVLLPVFGFLTLGMHAGFAVYFPELFPTRIRGSGTGFCFNAGRILAAPLLFLGGLNVGWQTSASVLSLLFLLGLPLLLIAPETKGCELE